MSKLYVTEDWSFNPSTLTLKYISTSKEATLDPRSGHLLTFLMDNHQQVTSRDAIYHELYGIENARADGTITAYVSKLRKLLENSPETKGKYIKTVSKAGYQFIGQFSIRNQAATPVNTDELKPQQESEGKQAEGGYTSDIRERQISYPHVAFIFLALVLISLWFSGRFSNTINAASNDSANSNWQSAHSHITQDNNVALSKDGLYVAIISNEKQRYSLMLKDSFSKQSRVIHQTNGHIISAPTFSPNGLLIAFLQQQDDQCSIRLINIETILEQQTSDEYQVQQYLCGLWHGQLKLSFINNDELLFNQQTSNSIASELTLVNIHSGEQQSLLVNNSETLGDFSFSVNSDSNDIAVLRDVGSSDTGVYIYDLEEQSLQLVLTTQIELESIEWLNDKKIIGVAESQLKLIDIADKSIRPTSLVMLREELDQVN